VRRREFLSSFARPFAKKEPRPVRPPYFADETDFEKCRECETKPCAAACAAEEGVLVIVSDGTPTLDFSESGCTYCDACAVVCEEGVLDTPYRSTLPPPKIDPLACMAWHHTICSSCRDACDKNAIIFEGLFRPRIADGCDGCGFCVAVCPSAAIKHEGV